MANYQLGPVIGKIGGGAEVQKIPANITASGSGGSEAIMHTVHVPEGETWLIVLSGNFNPNYTSASNGPLLFIGGVSIGPGLLSGRVGLAAEVTGTAGIGIRRRNSAGSDSFSGHVYITPLP